jgi:catechol 2,3-dioxygenase-like lactoylglutathione lyase family enzyme
MATPTLSGVHHLKFPVTDLDAGTAWYERVLGAQRVARFDHYDDTGTRVAVILSVPGLPHPVELRLAPPAVASVAGFDPVTFGVADRQELDRWTAHLDECGVAHSPIRTGHVGQLVEFRTPDGLAIRLHTDPDGGFEQVHFEQHVDYYSWVAPEG